MFSLADLQNSKALLKKRAGEPAPACAEPSTIHGTRDLSAKPRDNSDVKLNVPLPAISLQSLASARVGLHKVPSVKPSTLKTFPPATPRTNDQDDLALPAFARRKELFEKQENNTSNSLPTTAVVRVGNGNDQKVFVVDIKTLPSSLRFRDELRCTAGLEELRLLDHSPPVFQLFLDFCQTPQEPVKYRPGQYSTEPWITTSAAAWVLAVELRVRKFEKYALSQFIQNCAIVVKGPWKYIEEHAVDGSPLSRFSKHWIAWNTSLSSWWGHEYRDLEAADLAEQVTPETRDPRVFDIDHWYSNCGDDFNALCEHNPVHQEQQRQRHARKARPPPAEWGAGQELQAQYGS